MISTGHSIAGRDVELEFSQDKVEVHTQSGFYWDNKLAIEHVWFTCGNRRRDLKPMLMKTKAGWDQLSAWHRKLRWENDL